MIKTVDDSQHEKVVLLKERLQSGTNLRRQLETMAVCGAIMAGGRHWRSAGRSSGVRQPRKSNDPMLSTTVDYIGPLMRHFDARLRPKDITATFRTLEDELIGLESPELNEKLDLAQAWFWRFKPRANLVEWYADQSFRRIVTGHCAARWHFVDDPAGIRRTNGIYLDPHENAQLTTDPAVTTQNLWSHEWVIDAQVTSTAQANRLYKSFLEEKGRRLEGGPAIGALMASDHALNSRLFSLQPGAYDSKTSAVVVYSMFDEFWERLTVAIQRPKFQTRSGQGGDTQWFLLYDGDWPYGCPYLKLDCHKNMTRAYGDSFVVALTPQQNMISLMSRLKARSVFLQGMLKILVVGGALDEGEETKLRSNEQSAIIRLNRTAKQGDVQPMQMPRYDAAADDLLKSSIQSMYEAGSIHPVLQGATRAREPAAGYAQRIEQALVPLDAIVHIDRLRTERFVANMTEAALRHHGESTGRKLFVGMVGVGFAKTVSQGHAAIRRVLDAGQIRCRLRGADFSPDSVEEIEARFDRWIQAGRFPPGDPRMLMQFFLLTGKEMHKGQGEKYDNAMHIVKRLLRGENIIIGPYEPLDWIEWVCRYYLAVARKRGYTGKQRAALHEAVLQCESHRHDSEMEAAARQQAFAGSPTGGVPAGPTGGTPEAGAVPGGAPAAMPMAGGPETMALAGAPIGGALTGAAE